MNQLILFLGICLAVSLGSKLPEHAKLPAKECGKMINCYYTRNEPDADPGPALFVEDIDLSLCTHIYYNFFVNGTNDSVELLDPYADSLNGGLKQFKDLLKKYPKLKTLGTLQGMFDDVTGENVNNKVLTDPTVRDKLVTNIVNYVKKYGFFGMDINYSVPIQRGGRPADKENFVSLLKALRERFDKEHFTLSITADPHQEAAKKLYDIKGISKYANFINLKTFDFHGTSDADRQYGVGANSPLYHSSKENAEERKKNIDSVVKYWISEGAPPNKLIIGTSFTGISYALANPKQIGRGASFADQGEYGGPMAYFQFCDLIKKWKYVYDKEQQVAYAYKGNQLLAYDDVHSIKAKAEYVQKMNLGGAMVYAIDKDDVTGGCGEKVVLLKTLNRVLQSKC